MKKLLFLLLFFPVLLQAQLVEKFPKSSTNAYGYVILKPTSYTTTGSYPVCLYVHGAGGRGDGSSSALDALVSTQIPSNVKAAAEKFKFIIVAPQYPDAGNNAVIDHAKAKGLAIPGANSSKLFNACFSMGGGEVTRYATASQANADAFSALIIVAGLNGLQSAGIKYITQSRLPVLYFHANNDPAASVNNSKNGMAAINALNPEIPAKGIFYADGGHDITNRVFDTDKFPWTGNEIPNNLYEYVLSLTNEAPAVVPVLPGAVVPVAIADDITTATGSIALIGNKSRNCVASKSKWECISAPSGVNRWNINACSYIDCGIGQVTPLPAEGKYVFRLTVADATGQTATKDITVTYSKTGTTPTDPPPPAKTIVAKLEIILYSDGTTETKKLQ
jgi:hypothetical protein